MVVRPWTTFKLGPTVHYISRHSSWWGAVYLIKKPLGVFIHEVDQERKIMESTRPHPRAQVQSHPRAKVKMKESPLRAL